MFNSILLYIGSGIICVWGVAHIIPTKNIIKGFGKISEDNRKIVLMEWVTEGLAFIFLGVLVLLVTYLGGPSNPVSVIVIGACAGMLVVMAVWSMFTGARTSILPMKLCPVVKSTVAVLFILGIIL